MHPECPIYYTEDPNLSQTNSIKIFHHISFRSILILYSQLGLGLPSSTRIFSSVLLQGIWWIYHLFSAYYMSRTSHIFTDHPNNIWRVQIMNYWVFGLFPSFSILENRKRDVSETGSLSVLRWRGKTPTMSGPLETVNLNHWTTPVRFTQLFIHLRPG
jgi:hypothetical protein